MWVLGSPFMVLLVKMFRTETICFEKLGFFLLLGLMLLRYPNSNHRYFCSTQDRFPSINISRRHRWVCRLRRKRRKPTPRLVAPCKAAGAMADLCFSGLVLLSETVSILGCIIFLAVLCQLDKYTLCSLPSLLTCCWRRRFALFTISVNKVERCGLLFSFVFFSSSWLVPRQLVFWSVHSL